MKDLSLSRQLALPLLALLVLVVVVGVAGGGGVWFATRSINEIAGRVAPMDRANSAVLQDLTDAETGLRGWGLSGNSAALAPYEDGIRRLPDDLADLQRLTEDDARLRPLVAEQRERVDAWVEEYALVRAGLPGGAGTFDRALFMAGKQRFDAIRQVNGEVADDIQQQRDAAIHEADRRQRVTLAVIAIVTVLAFLAGWSMHRRVRRRTLPPLEDLESVASRLAIGDVSARAEVTGPREVREVALAINALAEENQRGREAEEAIQAELRTLDAARGDFVSNVSHELRTPLTSIAGYLEILGEEIEGDMAGPQRDMLDAINRNVVRLRTLVEDLLTLSRAEDRGTDLEQLDVRPLVEGVVADLGIAADRREISVLLDLPGAPVTVIADRGQLHRVFLNLVSNAIKFSEAGGEVQVRATVFGREALVQVIDQGIGIPAADLAQIGGRFFRARNAVAQQVPGTGLGLRITQTIVRNHGGRMELQSVEGDGTRVAVWLPLVGGHGDFDSTPAPA